jgi:Protein of unknown function (DUF3618)
MTTSGRESESSAGPPAETEPGGTVPENEQELRQEIEQTRERLGDTVELLVAKTDIKGRAQAKVAGLAGRVKGKSAPARSKATDRATNARSQAAGKSLMARQKATAGRNQLQARAAGAWQAAPEGFRRTAIKGADAAQGWVPLAAVSALLALGSGYMAYRSWPRH